MSTDDISIDWPKHTNRSCSPSEWNVFNFHQSKSIRFVVYNYALTGAHPMHMHGHNM